jgi:cell division septation protein DedD
MGASGAAVSGGGGSAAPASSEPTDVPAEDLSFFDKLSGPGQQAEPKREASQPESTPDPAPLAQAPSPGVWFVQIGAMRDRQAAEALVRALGAKGFRVRVDTEREGARGVLYKVRVGGYPTRPAADTAAAELKAGGQGGAFVVRVP